MSKWILVVGLVVVIILGLNILPLRRGPVVRCHSGSEIFDKKLALLGLPAPYLQASTHIGSDCYVLVNGHEDTTQSATKYDNYYFKPVGFAIDTAVAVVIIAGVAYLFGRKRYA